MKDQKQNRAKIVIVISAFVVLLIIMLGIMSALGIFDRNPNGVETKIDNFSQYLNTSPNDTKYNVFTALYNIIKLNSPEENTPPKSGAIIREGTFNNVISSDENDFTINYSTFIVDIESVQQSYSAQVVWSNSSEADLGGYPIIFACPTAAQLKYPSFTCSDLFTENTTTEEHSKFPIMNQLPINESSYSDNFAVYTQYNIKYRVSEDGKSLTLIITDDTGNSKEKAMQKIRDLGYDPSNYIIEYIDNSSLTEPPARAE